MKMKKLSLIIIITLILFGGLLIYSNQKTKINKYLMNNYIKINLNEKNKFYLIDKELQRNKIFITAETHGVSIN